MQNLVNENLKKALELTRLEETINRDLSRLREEISFIGKTVNSKVQQLEKVKADIIEIQKETSAYIMTGKWLMKEEPAKADVLSGIPATSAAVILPALHRNSLWNSLKNTLKNIWNFFSKKRKVKNQSNPVE
jgi:hypothetical protein